MHKRSTEQFNSQQPSPAQLEAWLKLIQVKGFGFRWLNRCKLNSHTDVQSLVQDPHAWMGSEQANVADDISQRLAKTDDVPVQQSLAWLAENENHHLLTFFDADYPAALKSIGGPPCMLFVKGDLRQLSEAQLAIVGSRNPSPSGKQQAKRFAQELVQTGWQVTSGLALGVDGLAHQGALDVGGVTHGVLGCGIDICYPRRHLALRERLLEGGGCLVSEFWPGAQPRPEFFPRRNRIISGLSRGTLVVEAAISSGSLITAKYAAEQGREVFALPGNVNNPLAAGCHTLIQQGAKLVTKINDINEEFQNLSLQSRENTGQRQEKSPAPNLARGGLLDSVDYEVTSIDDVAQRSGLPVTDVLAQLLEYELQGLVAAVPGGYLKLGDK